VKSPDAGQIILIDATLAEDLECSLTTDKAGALGIPGSEYLIVLLFLRLGKCPGNFGCRSYASGLIMLLEGLLQRQTAQLLLGRGRKLRITPAPYGAETLAGMKELDIICKSRVE